ncbi:MAG: small heat shock protein-like protein [Polaromonas sp.]|nr:small heat shock protein-like protein [Polaromonas sp.]
MFFAPAIRQASAASSSLGVENNAFERFMGDMFGGLRGPWDNIEENDQSWTVTLDLPGVTREQLSITTEGRAVRIETSPEARRQFKGRYEMPQAINPDGCEAKLENGVLTLRLAKVEQTSTSRQISVS